MKSSSHILRRSLAIFAVALCLPLSAQAQDPALAVMDTPRAQVDPSVTVNLADAVDRALRRSPQLAQAQNSLLVSETGRKTLWGSFIPNVNASARVNTQSAERFDPDLGVSVSGASDSYTAGLSGGLSLFEGGGRYYDLKQTQADIDGATARLEDQTAQVIFQTKSLFFAAVASRELLDVAEARLERARTGLDVVQRQVEVGSGTRSDLLRSQLEFQNAQLGVLQTSESLRAAQFALGRQVGEAQPVGPVVDVEVGPRPLPMSDEEIFVAAEEASPAVRAAILASESARLRVSSSRTAWIPSLAASGSWSWFNDDPAFSGGNSSWSVALSANYPIFNGFNRETQIERSRETYRVASLQETDARLAARQDADRALQAVYTAEQALNIAIQSLAVAEEDLRVVSERYRVGVAIILDVLASQEAVTQAGADVVRARFDYEVARADLEAILGREL